MAKNRFLPQAAAKVDERSGVPRRALLINFVIGLAFLLPLHSWQSIVAATSELALIAYALPSISSIAFRRVGATTFETIGGMRILAPAAFVLATLILYWATWKELRIALPVLLVGAVVYGVQQWRASRTDDGIACYEWGVRCAVRHLAAHPAPDPVHPDDDDSMAGLGASPDAA
jgi:amino acid transporter